jgi:hypothetical protein
MVVDVSFRLRLAWCCAVSGVNVGSRWVPIEVRLISDWLAADVQCRRTSAKRSDLYVTKDSVAMQKWR